MFQVDFKTGKPVYSNWWTRCATPRRRERLRPGEPLPSIRPLAEELRVNRNTIAKAYAELESQGVIETLPGKGCFLKESHTPFTKPVRQKILIKEVDESRGGRAPPASWTAMHSLRWSRSGSIISNAKRLKRKKP